MPFTRERQIKPYNFSNALIHCRDCTNPIVQSSILREARAFDTMDDLERTLCWMTCFQHGSLISSRVVGISQGILCTLMVVAVFFLPSFVTRYFPLSECLLVSMPFLFLNDVSMLIFIFLLCVFCCFVQEAGLIFHQWLFPSMELHLVLCFFAAKNFHVFI